MPAFIVDRPAGQGGGRRRGPNMLGGFDPGRSVPGTTRLCESQHTADSCLARNAISAGLGASSPVPPCGRTGEI